MYETSLPGCPTLYEKQQPNCTPVLVLPLPSLRAAQKRKRFEGMTESEQVVELALAIHEFCSANKGEIISYADEARNLLRVIKGEA